MLSPTTSGTHIDAADVLILLGLAGLTIVLLGATPAPALERTWILRPLVGRRLETALLGTTVVVLSAFAYLLARWSP